ncbi:MAG: ComEC/Rec2 family competence protein [Kiritimatiellia bacterium]
MASRTDAPGPMADPEDTLLAEPTPGLRVTPRPRRILPALAASFITGLATGGLLPGIPASWWLCTAAILLIMTAVLPAAWRRVGSATLILGILCSSGTWINIQTSIIPPDDVRAFINREREFIDIEGVIASPPDTHAVEEDDDPGWSFDLDTEHIHIGRERLTARGKIAVRLETTVEHPLEPRFGQRWRLRGPLRSDAETLRYRPGYAGALTTRSVWSEMIAEPERTSLTAWCLARREAAAERLAHDLPSDAPSAAMTKALLLGLRSDIDPAVRETFARTGALHILALSGMHVGIIIMLLVVVLKACGIHRQHWLFVLAPFLIAYTIGTGAAPSTIRASLMAICYFAAYAFRRQPDAPSALSLAALIMLLFDPTQLFTPGFLLSFVVVGGLIALVEPIRNLLLPRLQPDPWMEPETSWWAAHRSWWQRLFDLFAVSLAAWLVSTPIIAAHFSLISPVALLVNVPIVPLAFVILLTACLSVVSGLVFLPLAGIFNHANDIFARLLVELVDAASRLPANYSYVPAWDWLAVAGWFLLLGVWVISRSRWRFAAALGLILMLAGSLSQRAWSSRVDLVLIPAGDGSALLLDGPGRRSTLFDTGDDFYQRRLLQTIRSRGINQLDQIWVTRATSGAYGGLTSLLEAMPVGEVFTPDAPSQSHYRKAKAAWRERWGKNVIKDWPDDRHQEFDGLVLRALYPPADAPYQNARVSSMVIHASLGHRSVLYMGQAAAPLEREALSLPIDWHADVLAVGQIEGLNALSTEWLQRVQPESLLFVEKSLDRTPHSAHELLSRVQNDLPGVLIPPEYAWTLKLK